MGCCFSEPVDFDTEVNLFHFDLHRAVGKGAFGKVGHPLFYLSISTQNHWLGQGSRAQAFKEALCTQIH